LQEHCQLVKLAIADALEYYPLFSVVAVKGGQGKKRWRYVIHETLSLEL
jgi:hypothetical protein